MLTYLLPTRDRPERLARTLSAIGRLDAGAHDVAGGAEVVVVDDASRRTVQVPPRLDNGLPVRLVRGRQRQGAAARNVGAGAAAGEWLVMLDDDSEPVDTGHVAVIADQPPSVAAVGGEIMLDDGRREAGGLPEVFVGCGAIVRRSAFLGVGGYDPRLHYYAEEYDLCARLIRSGWRIVHDWRFRVHHHKTQEGRDMDLILRRLVRNNAWIMQRYAPAAHREEAVRRVIDRYARIAALEGAMFGYERGLDDLMPTIDDQPRTPLDTDGWDRFTGRAAAAAGLGERQPWGTVAIVDPGKHAPIVRDLLAERGLEITTESAAPVHVIGTLSPGPMMDAWDARNAAGSGATVLRAWTPAGVSDAATAGSVVHS
jgi:GT2 family glycosyltransferase